MTRAGCCVTSKRPRTSAGSAPPTRIAERTGPGAQNQTDPGGPSTGSGTGWAVTRFALDAWGNPARVVHPAAGNGRHYAQANIYDPDTHTMAVGSSDYDLSPAQAEAFVAHGTIPTADPAARGVSASAVYDARPQRVTSRTDINGAMTLSRYDALGRTTLIRLPDGKQLTYRYAPTGETGAPWPHATVRNHNLVTHTIADGLGRVIQTHAQTEADTSTSAGSGTQVGYTVSGAVEYDALGRPARAWHPTFTPAGTSTSDPPVLSTVRAGTDPAVSRYNALDEPVQHTDHNGALTSWSPQHRRGSEHGVHAVVDPSDRSRGTGQRHRDRRPRPGPGQHRPPRGRPAGGDPLRPRRPGAAAPGHPGRQPFQQSNAYDLQGRRIGPPAPTAAGSTSATTPSAT